MLIQHCPGFLLALQGPPFSVEPKHSQSSVHIMIGPLSVPSLPHTSSGDIHFPSLEAQLVLDLNKPILPPKMYNRTTITTMHSTATTITCKDNPSPLFDLIISHLFFMYLNIWVK
jgi:hypothetical protein